MADVTPDRHRRHSCLGSGFQGSDSGASNNVTQIVTAESITVTAATNTKGYDGTRSAAATPTITGGTLVTGDSANFTETYDSKNVGTGKTLTATGSVNDGNSGNNYTVTFVTNTTGAITARAITVTAATNTKTYDGTTSAAAIPTITTGTWPAAIRRPSRKRTTPRTSAPARR